jgi:endoglucanase
MAALLCLPLLAVNAGCRPSPWGLWNSYTAHFLDEQGRVIDPRISDRTTSEGEAYAMFFALVDNDREDFDHLLRWTQANLAHGDLQTHLPGWLWGKNTSGAWTLLDENSASDADLWMAYSLVEAGRLWKHPAYDQLGRRMLDQIARREVAELPGFGAMLLPAPAGYEHERSATLKTWTLNPSYLPLFLFERLAVVDPAGPWQKIALNIPRFLRMSAVHGYAMDWVEYVPGDGFYPAPQTPPVDGKPGTPVWGSYDAIRVYLWAGLIDSANTRRAEVLGAVPGMSIYLANHDAPPEKISDSGIPIEQYGPVGFSAAVLPYLRAYPGREKVSMAQMIRLSAEKNQETGLYGKDQAYYDQNLALFASGFLEGKYRFGQGGELKVEWTHA